MMPSNSSLGHAHDAADILRGISMTTRDGVLLVADIYGDLDRASPVVLERTPYGRTNCDQSEIYAGESVPLTRLQLARHYVDNGFVYIVQDCRGTGASSGWFDKYNQEACDTADTVNWIRSQTWSGGFVGMVGFSYGAACQVAAVGFEDARLQAVCVDCGGFSNAYRSGIRQGGAFALKQATWAYAQSIRDKKALGDTEGLAALQAEDLQTWLLRGPWSKDHSPLQAAPSHRDNLAALWQAGEYGPFWKRPGLFKDATELSNADTATLFVTSWFDTSLISTLDNFLATSRRSRARSKLIVGPWSHGNRYTSVSGEVDFGAAAIPENGLGASMLEVRLDWLRAAENETEAVPPASGIEVHYFEMGGGTGQKTSDGNFDHGGVWRKAVVWPPAKTTCISYSLTGSALVRDPMSVEPTKRCWTGDPDNPVPTLGGAINSGEPVMSGGMFDQNVLFQCSAPDDDDIRACVRDDVICFFTDPLVEDIVLAGPISAELWIICDQPDADITVKLIDSYPGDGPAVNVSDGILRLRYRDSWEVPALLEPGVPRLVRVMLNPVANSFKVGHRIRLDIAASNFPNYDVNPQTGAPQGIPGPRSTANFILLSDMDTPSRIELTLETVTP